MGQKIALWQRPGLETTAGDHERRIGILERQPEVDLSRYIHFGSNFGDELQITTSGPLPFGYGVQIQDNSLLGTRILANGNIDINSEAATSIIGAGSAAVVSNDIQLQASEAIDIHALGGDILIRTAPTTDLIASASIGLLANDGNAYLFGEFGVFIGAHMGVQSSTAYPYPGDPAQFLLSSARDLTVLLHKDVEVSEPTTSFIVLSGETAFPRQLFRVDSDNTIHGPVGGSITWDLV